MSADFLPVGLHYGVKASVYHADPCEQPSLSSGVVRTIINRSPKHAHLLHPRLGGEKKKSTPAMDLGSIVHGLMEDGELSDFVLGTYDNYRSKDAQAWRDSVEASGKTPVLERDLDGARPIAAALREKAGLDCTNNPFSSLGKSEVTAIWKEGETFCRARYDRLVIDPTGFADIWDWKTTTDCSPEAVIRKIVDQCYHIQAAFYLHGLAKLLPAYAGRLSFTFVFVETEAPYTVRRVCLNGEFLAIANRAVDRAVTQWQTAMQTGVWPDGCEGTMIATPPKWLLYREMEAV